MQTKLKLLLINMSVVAVLFYSCESNRPSDNTAKQTIDKSVEIELGKILELAIGNGNGDYQVTPNNDEVATAIIESNKLKIKALREGYTVLTVSDKTKRELRVAVNIKKTI